MGTGLVIIGGCGSSGTTLLTHLMSRSKYISSGPEFNCFNHPELYNINSLKKNFNRMFAGKCFPHGYIDVGVFMTFREQYGIHYDLVKEWLTSSNDAGSFIDLITKHMTSKSNTPFFIEKSPTNVYSFKIIADQFPEYHLVHLIRDGRDVVSSLMRRDFNLFGAGSRWLYDTLSGLQARGADNYIEIRYEDLVSNLHEVLAHLFGQLDIPFDAENILSGSSNSAGQYDENWKDRQVPRAWQQTPSDPISSSSVGRYKTDLSPQDIDILYRIKLSKKTYPDMGNNSSGFKELLDLLGYEHDNCESASTVLPYSKPKRFYLQAEDYFRRWKRFHDRYFWSFPPVLTYLD
jgi:hypothetical protein